MPRETQVSRLGGVRIALTIQTELIVDGRQLCSKLDMFHLGGVERMLDKPFDTREISLDEHLESCLRFLTGLSVTLYGKNEQAPFVEIISALTFAHQTFGWSGRYIDRQLIQTCDWAEVAEAAKARTTKHSDDLGYSYRGVELDSAPVRPLVQDFLDHAEWTLPSKVRDRTLLRLMLRSMYGD